MKQKISLTINGSRFDIDLDADFAAFLEKEMAKDFNVEGNNDFKTLLHAYVRKTHTLYEQSREIDALLKELEK